METLYSSNPQEVFNSAKAVEEELKLKRENARKLGLSVDEIKFLEVSLEYIKDYLEWYSNNLLQG